MRFPVAMQYRSLYLLLPALLLTACGSKPAADAPAGPPRQVVQPATTDHVVALGRIEPQGRIVQLSAEVAGIVVAAPVAEGQKVAAQTVLLELDHDIQEAQVQQAASKLATQQAQIAAEQAALARAEAQLANLQRTLDRVRALAAKGAETPQALDNAQSDLTAQQRERDRLRAQASSARLRLTELRADLSLAQAQRRQRAVRAQQPGQLLRLDVVPGDAVSAGQAFGEFAPAGPLTALCEVDELFAAQVYPGAKAWVRAQGRQDTLAQGTVAWVGPYLKKKSLFAETVGDAEDRRVREVRILLDGDKPLLLNSRVECLISLKVSQSAPTSGR